MSKSPFGALSRRQSTAFPGIYLPVFDQKVQQVLKLHIKTLKTQFLLSCFALYNRPHTLQGRSSEQMRKDRAKVLRPWLYLFFNRKYTLTICKIRICAFWYAWLDSNQRPLESESNALSNWATGAYLVVGFCDSRQIVVNDHAFFLCRSRKRRCGKALRHISTGDAWNVGVCHSIQLSYGRIFGCGFLQ